MKRGRLLTDRELRRLGPGEHGVGGVGGLVLRVRGESRVFVLRYRTRTGDQRSYTLGKYPDEVTLADAREKAAALRKRVRDGHDPVAERQVAKEALRMVDLLGENDPDDPVKDKTPGWYLGTYVKTAGKVGAVPESKGGKAGASKRKASKTAESIRTDRVYIRKHLRSRRALMRKCVDTVALHDLEKVKAEVSPGVWRKLRNILRVCFRHAEELGVIPHGTNPAARIKASPDQKVERYLGPEERVRLDVALRTAEETGPRKEGGLDPNYCRLFRLLALTGMRLGEALDLRWEFIDWRHGQIRLPTSKTGAKSVPLTPEALAFLRKEKGQISRVGRVCGNDGGRLDPHNVQRAWRSVRAAAKLTDVRIHDLRHSWASDAASAGVPLAVIGHVLGHKSPQTTHRYVHLHNQAIREGLAAAGKAIDVATKGSRES